MKNIFVWIVSIVITAACVLFILFMLLYEDALNHTQADSSNIVVVTQAPTKRPGASSIPESAPANTPAPPLTPEAASASVTFIEDAELRLPNMDENLPFGQRFNLYGLVQSTEPLVSITLTIDHMETENPLYPYVTTIMFDPAHNITSYSLEDAYSPVNKVSLNDSVYFDQLLPGRHSFTLSASTETLDNVMLVSNDFIVNEQSEWLQLYSNNFRNNYLKALAFFKEPERFLFKYKFAEGHHITTDPEWVKKYITSIEGVNERTWKVHVDAIPYFKKAARYLENTYVRVQGNGHDSGIIKLTELIKTFNGSYNSRFVTDKTFISHHAFGTAADFNAEMVPNNNDIGNHAIIKHEVGDCLKFNGIIENGRKSYYDFTYTGEWQEYYKEVPTSVINYLLYELAFYRAGFGWGYYYAHTCDAMHFTLTERDISEHSDADTGLRKVFKYE